MGYFVGGVWCHSHRSETETARFARLQPVFRRLAGKDRAVDRMAVVITPSESSRGCSKFLLSDIVVSLVSSGCMPFHQKIET